MEGHKLIYLKILLSTVLLAMTSACLYAVTDEEAFYKSTLILAVSLALQAFVAIWFLL